MPPGQLECKRIVIEITPELVRTVMAVQTGSPKRNCVIHHESSIDAIMAALTDLRFEDRDIGSMTIATLKRFLRCI